jgi:hypothetical protein
MPGSPFGAPQPVPPACQELLAIRDEVGRHGQAIQAAGKKKAGPEQLCKLFKAFTAAEANMIMALEERKATCGVPDNVITQVQGGHTRSTQIAKQVCDRVVQMPGWDELRRYHVPAGPFSAPAPLCSEILRSRSQPVPCVD